VAVQKRKEAGESGTLRVLCVFTPTSIMQTLRGDSLAQKLPYIVVGGLISCLPLLFLQFIRFLADPSLTLRQQLQSATLVTDPWLLHACLLLTVGLVAIALMWAFAERPIVGALLAVVCHTGILAVMIYGVVSRESQLGSDSTEARWRLQTYFAGFPQMASVWSTFLWLSLCGCSIWCYRRPTAMLADHEQHPSVSLRGKTAPSDRITLNYALSPSAVDHRAMRLSCMVIALAITSLPALTLLWPYILFDISIVFRERDLLGSAMGGTIGFCILFGAGALSALLIYVVPRRALIGGGIGTACHACAAALYLYSDGVCSKALFSSVRQGLEAKVARNPVPVALVWSTVLWLGLFGCLVWTRKRR
jgi:hypothetical protein